MKPRTVISLARDDQPVMRVWGTHNVLVYDVNFWLGVKATSAPCENIFETRKNVCPAIHVYQSYGVTIAKGTVFGRIDIVRAMQSRIDGMRVTATSDFDSSNGAIRVQLSGHGPRLLRSNIVISNNEVYGVHTPIVLYNGAVGVTVTNNYVHDFVFTGIRCGADVSYQGDCMLSRISRNLVVNRRSNSNGDYDSAGIYWCTHWFNPGNSADCNYVIGGDHCYYLDYAATGITINGGACINTRDGVKVNNGKRNTVTGLVMKNVDKGAAGWCTCLTVDVDNCNTATGRYWEAMRKTYYNNPAYNKNYPWLQQICQQKSINGKPCNPRGSLPAATTGACSGIATDNYLDLLSVGTSKAPALQFFYCENVTVMGQFNTHRHINWTAPIANLQFVNYQANNLAVAKTSPIYKLRPGFKSCDRRQVGPQVVPRTLYLSNFNVPEPKHFKLVVRMQTLQIHDADLRKATS
eukprot:TRINITY_DN23467_c0_g2_i2.p1 TRINITY_DN23467_c0_g2~~TRINITY_DN23467_c0_g2_i2.p1  ORF type:complete len:471 (+),score=-1.24 TRINITY_DN23467_c0_g2_i2:23-1414(+)